MTGTNESGVRALESWVCGHWQAGDGGSRPLFDPSTEEEIGQASSEGIDFTRVIAHGREVGGPALRALTFAERAERLKAMSKTLRAHRDDLLEVSGRTHGTTDADGSFDIDGAFNFT